jgi:hypothetical protein
MELFPNGEYTLDVQHKQNNTWYVYISKPNTNRRGKVELMIEESLNPEDTEVIGSVLRHGCVSRRTMALIMDTLVERL